MVFIRCRARSGSWRIAVVIIQPARNVSTRPSPVAGVGGGTGVPSRVPEAIRPFRKFISPRPPVRLLGCPGAARTASGVMIGPRSERKAPAAEAVSTDYAVIRRSRPAHWREGAIR
ncbi:hypothetical protein LSAT2_004513 [Lamellibrachia satsuma]|nr:hypothetical protein LSAT2_004513 [Lamellibrachia satsuma]